MIIDNQQLTPAPSVTRLVNITPSQGKATICIGVRRCGKSTYLGQVMQSLRSNGVTAENILHLNFFDDRLYTLQQQGLNTVIDAYFSLYPEKKGVETIYCFFDEIQMIPNWEAFVERLMRTEKCVIYLTGSSATLLSKEIATQMRGRALAWEMFPFSLREFLTYHQISLPPHLSSKQQLMVQKTVASYWQNGGFPEVADADKVLRVKIHQAYFHDVLFRDLIERYNIAQPNAVRELAHWLVDNIAGLYSVNKLTTYLANAGYKISTTTVTQFLAWFEDAYFFFSVMLFDASLKRQRVNPKKIYCIDHAMVTSVSSGILVNSGHLLENLVFVTLRRESDRIYYYKTKMGKEVDFIVQRADRSYQLVQVCESLYRETTRLREITALNEAMMEMGVDTGYVVTRDEDEVLPVEAGQIVVLPVWRFLLGI